MDEGEKWTYKNSGKLNELTTEAKHEYTKPKTIEKSEVNQDGINTSYYCHQENRLMMYGIKYRGHVEMD